MNAGKQKQVSLMRQYKAGYQRKPENKREEKAAEAMAILLFATHPDIQRSLRRWSELEMELPWM